jgi:hypothetical protein
MAVTLPGSSATGTHEWRLMPLPCVELVSANSLKRNIPYTIISVVLPDPHAMSFQAHFACFQSHSISYFQHVDCVWQVWDASYVVGWMHQYSMTADIDRSWNCALTALSMSRMISLTSSWLVHFLSHLGCTVFCHSNNQYCIMIVGHLLCRFGVKKFCMACTTLAHTPTQYPLSQGVY